MVTRDEPWPAGTPCWVDVSVDHVATATAFYEALFDWDVRSGGPDAGGYAIAYKDGRVVAGLGPKMGDPSQPPAWMTYLATDDADGTAARIKAAGGQLFVEPVDVLEQGRMAVAMDPAGAVFGLWESGLTKGVGLANEPGSLCWSEQLSGDYEASKDFYHAVFGYEYQDISGPDVSYAMLLIDGHEVGGIGQQEEGAPAVWSTYFAVANTDDTVARVDAMGGTVVRSAWDSEYGRMAVLADDQGAVFSVIEAPPES